MMITRSLNFRRLTLFLITVFSATVFQVPAHAAMISTQDIASATQLDQQRAQLSATLLRADVKDQLTTLGVDPQSVEDRINNLSQAELSQLQQQIDQLPAGSGVLGTIAVVLLILILLDITGLTDIFPGV